MAYPADRPESQAPSGHLIVISDASLIEENIIQPEDHADGGAFGSRFRLLRG